MENVYGACTGGMLINKYDQWIYYPHKYWGPSSPAQALLRPQHLGGSKFTDPPLPGGTVARWCAVAFEWKLR